MKGFAITALAAMLGTAAVAPLAAIDVENDIVRKAEEYVGCEYRTGGTQPAEFDCSGFVGYIVRPFVPDLPRLSRDMSEAGTKIAKEDLMPGDLVFFATSPTPGAVSHVALYIGSGSIIHAISDGPNRGVTITALDARYWKERYHSSSRVLPRDQAKKSEVTVVAAEKPVEFAKGSFSGELKNGEPDGKGTMKLANGDTYTGEFSDGTISGTGTYVWKDGTKYTGKFSDGKTADGKDTYVRMNDSAWETWNGYVMGDYEQWKAQQQRDFEAMKGAYDPKKESSNFEEWKKKERK